MRDSIRPTRSSSDSRTPLQVLRDALPLDAADCPNTRAAAKVCALASLAAYSDDPATLCSDWECEIIPISNDDADLVIFYDDNITLVACRGSEFHWKDWLRNLMARPVRYLGGVVHSGFHEGHKATSFDLMLHLAELQEHSIRLIVFTGHSQGAANAVLHAWRLSSRTLDVSIVTFGSPRVGDSCFAQLVNAWYPAGRHLRFMHSNDIVPRIPVFFRNAIFPLLPSLTRRFKHCGTPILITESGEWIIKPTRWQAFWSRIKGFRFDMVRDHLMANYLGAIDKCE